MKIKHLTILFFIFVFTCVKTNGQGVITRPNQVSHSSQTAASTHRAVDLGLTVLWAESNLGAKSPTDTGKYFAWGEINPKDGFSETNFAGGDSWTYSIKPNRTQDAATKLWGGGWRIPTAAEVKELITKCHWQFEQRDGVIGYRVTGPNGRSIFLPAAGKMVGCDVYNLYEFGLYQTSNAPDSNSDENGTMNYRLDFDQNGRWLTTNPRFWGLPIRPVKSK